MNKPQTGITCPGCPHRAAYVAVKQAMGRGRGRVYCGNAGCSMVGQVHPAATTFDGGNEALLPRYRQEVPTPQEGAAVRSCAHFVLASELMDERAPQTLATLASEGGVVLLCVLASSRAYLLEDAVAKLCERACELGAADAIAIDPFDTLNASGVVEDALEVPGVHAIVFSSPCAQLLRASAPAPVEVDPFACVGCQRCKQITGCPALAFTPPVFTVDAEACAGCDLCCDFCRTHVIYSPRSRLSLAERREQKMAIAKA